MKTIQEMNNDKRYFAQCRAEGEILKENRLHHLEQYQYLIEQGRTEEAKVEKDCIDDLKLCELIAKTTQLELQYRKAILSLPNDLDRQIAFLSFIKCKNYQQISQLLYITLDTVKTRMRSHLRRGVYYIGIKEQLQKLL